MIIGIANHWLAGVCSGHESSGPIYGEVICDEREAPFSMYMVAYYCHFISHFVMIMELKEAGLSINSGLQWTLGLSDHITIKAGLKYGIIFEIIQRVSKEANSQCYTIYLIKTTKKV